MSDTTKAVATTDDFYAGYKTLISKPLSSETISKQRLHLHGHNQWEVWRRTRLSASKTYFNRVTYQRLLRMRLVSGSGGGSGGGGDGMWGGSLDERSHDEDSLVSIDSKDILQLSDLRNNREGGIQFNTRPHSYIYK
eukprot:GHVR01008552.1.p1 GENE.GHVR01008552.1~~GHVR01008552.1.p1  ORF type:complete len:137 (+),score=30.27 GHVR01008552.1:62-472(+)